MSRLSKANFNEFQIKYILGKAIGVSDRTYLQTLKTEVEEKYPKLYNDYLNIAPMVSTEQVKKFQDIEQQIQTTQKEIEGFKLQIFNLQSDFRSLVSALEEKLGVHIDANKLLKAHEAKYSEDNSNIPPEEEGSNE